MGDNSVGRLALDPARNPLCTPPSTLGMLPSPIGTLTLGDAHGCGVAASREVYCWGLSREGQLGVGQDGLFDARSPLRIESLRDVVVVTAGWAHTCARRRDGTMWCWGANDVGQLGNGLPEHPAQGFAVRW